jgi:hypothetical protein
MTLGISKQKEKETAKWVWREVRHNEEKYIKVLTR